MRGINEQVLKTSGDDVFSSRRKLRKTSEGSGNHRPTPPPTPLRPPCTSEGLIPLPAQGGKLNCNVIKRAKAIFQTI